MNTSAKGLQARFHTFLRRLRANGRSNMYGAVPYLMRAFSLDRDTAFRVICEWLDAQESAPGPAEAVAERLPRRTGTPPRAGRKKRGTRG
jgi:hypothetical protein